MFSNILRETAFRLFWINSYFFCIPLIIKPLKLLTYWFREGNKYFVMETEVSRSSVWFKRNKPIAD